MMRILALVLVLAGCANTSDVVPYGIGTYIVSASGDTSVGSATHGEMRVMAAKAANDFCAKVSKKMSPVESSERSTVGSVSSSLVFRCD
jgi:hypothetical protein